MAKPAKKIHIDLEQFNGAGCRMLMFALQGAMAEFYSDPENVKEFEIWREERRKRLDTEGRIPGGSGMDAAMCEVRG